ncbi:MAG TPA: HIT family protein [Candidatus Saccharimonadales bacterium]|nr:HIT family protein [Candidatus Saccharimonadales bacterium]
MADKSLFEKIADGELPSYKVWEDDTHVAFLTPFANTLGQTVIAPKKNIGAYMFDLSEDELTAFMLAVKKVAKLLQKAFAVPKVGMVIEGEGVAHVHAKLYPMHGIQDDRSKFPKHTAFFKQYPGYLASFEGPKMTDEELAEVQKQIVEAADEA